MKVVIFITGLLGAGITTVMIPYFSSFMAKKQILAARQELLFFLITATVLTIPLTTMLYILAPTIIRIIFEGGAMGGGDILKIAEVMRFGIIQLPFFTCSTLIMRYATANQRSNLVLIAAVVGLVINVALNYFFMTRIGVAGIALAISLSLAVSSTLLMVMIHRLGHLAWFDVAMLIMNWLVYLTFIICIHFHSYAGVFSLLLAYLFLLYGHWKRIFAFNLEDSASFLKGYY
jgi:peptidoglycan biosynthesis protein MviN/MurJ (putative lipid II flippase)